MMNILYNNNNGPIASPQQNSNDNSNSNKNNGNRRKMYQEEQRDDDNEENNNSNNNCGSMTPFQSPSSTFYTAENPINEENDHREYFPTRQEVVDNDAEIIMVINSHSNHSPNSSTSFPSSSFVSPTKKRKSSLSSLPLSSFLSPSSRPSSSFSSLSPPPLLPRKSLSSSLSLSSSSSSSFPFNQEREGGEEDLAFLAFPTLLSHDEHPSFSSTSSSSTLLLPRLTSSPRRITLAPRNVCIVTTFPDLEITTEDNKNNNSSSDDKNDVFDSDDDTIKMNNNSIFEKKRKKAEDEKLRSPPSITTCISFDDYNDDADTHIPIRDEDDAEEAILRRYSFSFSRLQTDDHRYRSPSPCVEKVLFPSSSPLSTASTFPASTSSSLSSSSLSSSNGNNNTNFLPSLQMRRRRE